MRADSTIGFEKNYSALSDPQNTEQAPTATNNTRLNSHEAGLRHIIRLQRQALSRQNLRIQQQRSVITQLNQALRKSTKQSDKQPNESWFRLLLRSRMSKQDSH